MRTRLPAAVAGMVAVGAVLGVAELLAAVIAGMPSLVAAVGSLVIPVTPPAVESWAIATFGTSDKAVLAAGTVAITLGAGAYAGVVGLHERARAMVVVAVFAAIGVFAGIMQPLVTGVVVVAVTITLALLAWGILRLAWDLIARGADVAGLPGTLVAPSLPDGDPTNPPLARRQFVGLVGGVGTVAVAAVVGARAARPGPVAVSSQVPLPTPRRGLPSPSAAASFDVDGLTPIVVPNEDFYRIDTALSVPRIDPDRWSLRVRGLVDTEIELTYDDLLARSHVEADVTIACVSNEVGGTLVGNARWLGTRLGDLLDEAGIQPGAAQVVGRAVDGFTVGFPLEAATDGRDSLVVVGMNGERLPAAHGFPARLIVPGLYGYVSATKWLTEIELTTWDGFDAYWVPRGWSKEGPIKTQSRIDVPRNGARVTSGPVAVAGVAWAPHVGIDRVEVRLDEGEWQDVELSEPLSRDAWVQWRSTVRVEPGDHRLQVRATDARGQTQGPDPVPPRPDGAEGWHTVVVRGS